MLGTITPRLVSAGRFRAFPRGRMQHLYVTPFPHLCVAHLPHVTDRYGVEFLVLDCSKLAMAIILPSKAHFPTLWMHSIYPP
jgi:hypothetical protein